MNKPTRAGLIQAPLFKTEEEVRKFCIFFLCGCLTMSVEAASPLCSPYITSYGALGWIGHWWKVCLYVSLYLYAYG